MNSKDLLAKLSVLEALLHDFSYEELSGQEAAYLKKSFDNFKKDLEALVYEQREPISRAVKGTEVVANETYDLPPEIIKSESKQKTSVIQGVRILVFEDNSLSQRLIELQLEQLGCKVFVTDNATIGLQTLEDRFIDLVLMDLRMPLMSGFEVSELIRGSKEERIANVPIIAFSADISFFDQEKCKQVGINDFVLKPYSVEELSFKIAKATGRDHDQSIPEKSESKSLFDGAQEVDIAPLLTECEGDIGLLRDLVDLFRQNSTEFVEVAKTAIMNQDLQKLKFAAHKIKNGLAMVGAKKLRELVLQIYAGCESKTSIESLSALYDQYIDDYQIVDNELVRQLDLLGRK
ncbi:response regulator [Maribacter algicola]|uniref:Response regulator n=1 Tax=Meishania litoralis TaxID=3434685 RepID=A0ACC7LJT7_9FLAO